VSEQYKAADGFSCYFAGDGSGIAAFCLDSGDTHFINVDPAALGRLLEREHFSPSEWSTELSLGDDQSQQLLARLVAVGMIVSLN